jgi:hypothetical protein
MKLRKRFDEEKKKHLNDLERIANMIEIKIKEEPSDEEYDMFATKKITRTGGMGELEALRAALG